MSKKIKPAMTEQVFNLTDKQQGVLETLNSMVAYQDELYVVPMRQAISKQLTQYAQEHFEYADGTQLKFDIDLEDLTKPITVINE